VVVRVSPEEAEEARQVIEEYRTQGAAEEGELNSETPEIGGPDET
jgi:hypothetical protein